MKKFKIIFSFVFSLFFVVSLQAQNVKDVFKTAFPEAFGKLKIDSTTTYNPALKHQYRKLYYKLSDALGELQAYQLGAITSQDQMKIFDYKAIKHLAKEKKLDSLRLLIHQEQKKIADLMRNERFGADSIKAINLYIGYRNAVQSHDFNDAYNFWTALYHQYPRATKTIYTAGVLIMHYKIKNARDSVERAKWIDTLMQLYDRRMAIYPKDSLNALALKIVDYYELLIEKANKKDSLVQLRIDTNYHMAMKAIKMGGLKTPPYVYPIAMPLTYYMYAMGKISAKKFIQNYILFTNRLNKLLELTKSSPKNQKILKQYLALVDNVFAQSNFGNCKTFGQIFGPMYDSIKTDLNFISSLVNLMTRKGCTNTKFFRKIAIDLYKLKPTAKVAFNIAMLYTEQKIYDSAAIYFNEAIKLETNDSLKALYYLDAAKIANKRNQFPLARDYALKAAKLRPHWGDPYILIAMMYAASAPHCGKDVFQHKAVYWAAVDKLYQAEQVDPSVKDKVQPLIANYTAHFPDKENGFMHGVYEGSTYTIDYCWIHETTKARYPNSK